LKQFKRYSGPRGGTGRLHHKHIEEETMIEKLLLKFKWYRAFIEKQEKKRVKYLGG